MTGNLKGDFLKAFKNEDGLCSLAYFCGENANTAVTIMEMGLSFLHEREPIWRTNGFQIASYSYFHVDRAIDHFKESPDKRGLFVVSSLEMLFGEKTVLFDKDARELFYKLLDVVHENGGQVLLGAACPPEELAGMDEAVRERILGGLVCHVDDGEELGGPIDELTALGLLPAREKGRYAALYEERFLDLFPGAPTETLSEEQLEALGELNKLARSAPMRRSVSIVDSEYRKLNELFPADKWDADMLAFEICYPFWNRFNSGPEGYEIGFAKSGQLGQYLRYLKERDRCE